MNEFQETPTAEELAPLGAPVVETGLPDHLVEERHGFAHGMLNELALGLSFQTAAQLYENAVPNDPNWNGATTENVKGFERHIEALAATRSKFESDHLKERIKRNERMRSEQEIDGSLWQSLAAGVLDPINLAGMVATGGLSGALIGGPQVVARGALQGAVRLGAYGSATAAAGEGLRPFVDPTAPADGQLENIVYAGLIGGALGGVLGRLGAGSVNRWAKGLADDHRALDEALSYPADVTPARAAGAPVGPDLGIPEGTWITIDGVTRQLDIDEAIPEGAVVGRPLTNVNSGGRFEALPTTPDFTPGLAPTGIGLENLPAIGGAATNPLYNSWVSLVQSGHRATQEWAQSLAGELGLLTRENIKGNPTQISAFLRAHNMQHLAAVADRQLMRLYAEYLGKQPAEPLGMNLTVMGRRIADSARGLIGRAAPDGKMSFHDWKEGTYMANRHDRIEADARWLEKDPAAKESIEKAAREVVRPFYDKFREAIDEVGAVDTPKWVKQKYDELKQLWSATETRLAELSKDGLTPQEQVEFEETLIFRARLHNKLANLEAKGALREEKAAELTEDSKAPETVEAAIRLYGHAAVDLLPANDLEGKVFKYIIEGEPPKPKGSPEEAVERAAETQRVIDGRHAFYDAELQRTVTVEEATDYDLTDFIDTDGSLTYEEIDDALDAARKLSGPELAEFEAEFNVWRRERLEQDRLDDINSIMMQQASLEEEAMVHSYNILDKDENVVADLHISESPDRKLLKVEWVGTSRASRADTGDTPIVQESYGSAAGRANTLGARFTIDVGQQLRRLYPNATHILGFRVSGARERAGTENRIAQVQLPRDPRIRQADGPIHSGEGDATFFASMRPANDMREEPRLPKLNGELDPNYISRVWHPEKILEDLEGENKLYPILARAYKREDGIDYTPEDHKKWVDSLFEADNPYDGAIGRKKSRGDTIGSARQIARRIPVTNEEVAEFIERDISTLMRGYSHRMAPTIEAHRKFGSRDMEESMHAALVQVIRESTGTVEEIQAKVKKAREDMEFLRAEVLGDKSIHIPLNQTKVGVETAKNVTSTLMLGSVIFSQLPDLVRPFMSIGFARTFGFALHNMIGNLEGFKKAGKDLEVTNEIMDVVTGMSAERFMEAGAINGNGSRNAQRLKEMTDPINKLARGPWYLVNLMSQMTDATKNFTQIAVAHYLIEDMRRLVAGGLPDKKAAGLARLGLGKSDAEAMLAYVQQSGSLNLAAVSEWPDEELRAKFVAAVTGETRRIIVTPGPTTKSPMSQGYLSLADGRNEYPILTLPFQFMSYGMAATQKIAMSALQGQDANALLGMGALVGMAYVGNWLRTDDKVWKRQTLEEQMMQAVDKSGVLGSFADLNKIIETGTRGAFGARPMFGMPPQFGKEIDEWDQAALAGGPVGSKLVDAFRAFSDDGLTDHQQAGIVRRSIPLNNVFYLKWMFEEAQEVLGY